MASTRILIVHEEDGFLARMREGLEVEPYGYEVLGALSAPRAIGMAGSKQPDVLVIDTAMTGVDGYALTEQIRADAALATIPVILVSKHATESSRMKARQAGAAAHLPEDVAITELHETIQRVLGRESVAEVTQAAQTPVTTGPPEAASVDAPKDESAGAPQPADAGYGAPKPAPETPTQPTGGGAKVAAGREGLSGERRSIDIPSIDDLLRLMIDRGGSDLHVTVGSPPGLRLRGELVPVENIKVLTPRDVMEMILNLLSEEQRRKFETELELDFAYSIPGVSRFRANVFQQRNSMAAVFRVIPLHIPTIDELQLPQVCRYLADRPRGLVLVTGPTGAGKSTTQAAMLNHINESKPLHIITMEDPIEFLHQNKKAYVNQREVGEDTHSFASALKRVLRQDPDVILVGEMRDLETISAAITAAETGHLVLATLHTTGGPETVDRIIDVFPPHQQQQVRMQLSNTLEGVLSQVLLRSTDGKTRVLAMEIMRGTSAIRNLIREGKTHQMMTIIQGGSGEGMQTLDQHLKLLLQQGKITYEDAIGKAQNPKELAQMLGRKF